ncbi:MAG: hypothetical protein FWG42_08505 [Clostridiales bacterium]|nr:hypothetical protein [Clostridiales bacterium]
MNDLLKVLIEAKNKMVFTTQKDFVDLLKEIEQNTSSLELDWDDGAGEEWARFIHHEFGKVYMINSKIGIIFAKRIFSNEIPQTLYDRFIISIVECYDKEEWHVDLETLRKSVSQIEWNTSDDIVNPNAFSLDDLYYATI